MFISKKNFAREISKAKREAKEEIRQEARIQNLESDLFRTADRIQETCFRRIDEAQTDFHNHLRHFEERLYQLEMLVDKYKQKGCKK